MFQRKHISLFAKTFLILSVIFIMVLPMLFANNIIKGITDTSGQAANAWAHFSTARYNYLSQLVSLWILDVDRAALTVSYKSNKTTMEKEAIELATAAIPTSVLPTDLAANLTGAAGVAAKMAITAADDLALKKALVAKTLDIQKKKVVVSQYKTTLNEKYNHYVDHIDAFNCSNETPSDDMSPAEKGEIPSDEIGVDTNLEVKCSNPDCSTVYSASVWGLDNIVALSEGGSLGSHRGHLVMCYDQAHPGYESYSCPPDYPNCDLSRVHWRLCPGTCGEKFPPKKILIGRFNEEFKYIDNFPHEVICKERVFDGFLNVIINFCYLKYDSAWYTCEHSRCPNSTYHNDDDEEANAGGTTPTTTPTESSLVVCTISGCQNSTPYDPTSSSAGLHAYHSECSQYKCNGVDHSWQTSCSDTAHTNTNGDSCTASGFYECVSHTPVYLSSDNGNNDNDDSSTQVRCGHCDEDYDPQWDGEEHTRIWTCSFCGQDYISCLDEVCTSSSYGYHYPR